MLPYTIIRYCKGTNNIWNIQTKYKQNTNKDKSFLNSLQIYAQKRESVQ